MTRPRHGALSRAVSAHFSLSPRLSARPLQQEGGFSPDTSLMPHPRMAWIYRVDQGRHLPTVAQNDVRTDRRNLSKAGWVRLRGCPRHGPEACLGRVGQDAQPRSCRVRRTAHTSKPRPSPHGRVDGVPRSRTHHAMLRNAAVASAVAVASAGAGRSPASPLRRTAVPGAVPAAAARPWFPGRRRSRSVHRCCRSRGGRAG